MAAENSQNDADRMTPRRWLAVIGTLLGAFMAVLDIQITNSSLSEISGGIAATPSEGSWISTAYLIGEIITIPLTAWLVRVFSTRIYLAVNIVLFLIFSALCGFSTSLLEMIVFRFGQGFTGGVFIPVALTVVATRMPPHLRPVGQALFGITATLAPSIGPTVGGWLTNHFGWEWNFFVNFLPGSVMLSAVIFAIDPEKMKLGELRKGDWWGILCMAIGLGSLIAMLEEGQREDWFGSDFIVTCGLLAVVFIPAFILIEIYRKEPFVNLRLLANRNLALASIVAFGLGLGLYGSVYIIPLYLGQIQGFDPLQIGEVLVWVGLPQLLIFPFLPLLMKRFDLRLLVSVGCLIFASSCLLNAGMDYNTAGPQLTFSNIVRALGQPFTIVPVTTIAITMLGLKDAGDGSAIFNIFRNVGGSAGIAILSTVVTRRQQFHDWRLGENVTAYDLATQGRIASLQQRFIQSGSDAATALQQSYGSIKATIQREAFIMAYNDAFLIVAAALFIGAVLIWFCTRVQPRAGVATH